MQPAFAPPTRPWSVRRDLILPDAAATARLGTALARVLGPGDTVLLSGPLGAGKSALARALIAARLAAPGADIPSPSYTLVNVYDTAAGPIWHADLYRLGPGDLDELGLVEAYAGALCLIEWPERLGAAHPDRALSLGLTPRPDDARHLRIATLGTGWDRVQTVLDTWE